jgi:hypothetical protein
MTYQVAGVEHTHSGYALVAHSHGNITNTGYIGSVATLPIITGTGGILTTGSFSTTVGTFCQGNDTRVVNAVQTSRNLTINGTTYNLSADRTWTIATGGISGSGTANYVPKFTGATAVGDSLIQDNGTTITLGTSASTTTIAGYCSFKYTLASNTLWLAVTNTSAYSLKITDAALTKMSAQFNIAGGVQLSYNGVVKIETTSVGVSVTGSLTATADVGSYSDRRIKKGITPLQNSLAKVLSMNPVSYKRIEDDSYHIGFIAQEMLLVEPCLVSLQNDYYSLAYGNITALLAGAIKEQNSEVEDLKGRVEFLELKLLRNGITG